MNIYIILAAKLSQIFGLSACGLKPQICSVLASIIYIFFDEDSVKIQGCCAAASGTNPCIFKESGAPVGCKVSVSEGRRPDDLRLTDALPPGRLHHNHFTTTSSSFSGCGCSLWVAAASVRLRSSGDPPYGGSP